MSKPRRKIPLRRRLVFTAIAVSLGWLIAEGLAWCGMSVAYENFSFASWHRQRESLQRGTTVSDGAAEVIHPYLGWAFSPTVAEPVQLGDRSISINGLGFADEHDSVVRRRDDQFILGIAGGSVAWQVSVDGEELIREMLEASPLLRSRKVRIVRMAMSGYKQPQQVMTLNYLMSLGGEFDAVINIDGYNETALAIAENARVDVSIAYPRSWNGRTVTIADPRESAATAELIALRGQRQSMAKSMNGSIMRFSPVANLIWRLRDTSCRTGLRDLAGKLVRTERSVEDRSFASFGPYTKYASDQELDDAIIALWKRSSLLMQHVCDGHGAAYVHMLQANQYHEGSKPMSSQEREDSIAPFQRAGLAAKRLYPQLVKTGPSFAADGIRFSDQTMIFSQINDPIYVDGWCHYNARGNRLMAKAACDELLKELAEQAAPR